MLELVDAMLYKSSFHAIIAGFILILIFYHSLILNLNRPLGLSHGDSFQTSFILKHYVDIAYLGNWSNLPNMPMVYGFKNSLFYSEGHFMQGIWAIPVNFLTQNIIITTNLLALLTVFLSFLTMFFLAYFWTDNFWASIGSGMIFSFSPFVMARFPDQMIVYSLYFFPLIFIFVEKLIRDPKGKNGLFLGFMLVGLLLSSSLYYAAFLLIFLPLYLAIRIRQLGVKLRSLLTSWTITGIVLVAIITATLGYFHLQVFSSETIGRDLIDAESFSAWPTDYLFANQRNLIYGNFKNGLLSLFPNLQLSYFSSMNGLFLGIIPIILLGLSFKVIKAPQRPILWLFWSLLVIALLLSFGPKIHLTKEWVIPGPYRLLYEIPIFKFLRDISRFGMVVVFATAFISALSLDALSKKLPRRNSFWLMVGILSLVVLEYWNRPLDFTYFSQDKIIFYQKLQVNPQIKVILDYPIGNSLNSLLEGARPAELDAYYLLLASTLHNKILFNGYNAFLPKGYYERTNQISTIFPTSYKLGLLKNWGVDAIILHKDQFFVPNQFENIKTRLDNLGINVTAESQKEILYVLHN